MDKTSTTAQWIAIARAAETIRPDALFSDDLALLHLRLRHPDLLEELRANPTARFDVIALRTAFFDDFLRDATGRGIRQVAVLAAGLDGRAFRLDLPLSVRWFEVDLPELLAEKEALVASGSRLWATCERHVVAADLTGDWVPRLTAAGFDPGQPTVWLIEGLLYYLTGEQGERLLETVSGLSPDGSLLALEHVNADLYRAPWMRDWLAQMRTEGRPWQSGVAQPEEWLARHGWVARVVEPADLPGAERRQLPRTPPRAVPGAARTWLITARRTSTDLRTRAGER